jgi:hypothetical protein
LHEQLHHIPFTGFAAEFCAGRSKEPARDEIADDLEDVFDESGVKDFGYSFLTTGGVERFLFP